MAETILVIDDDLDSLKLIGLLLQRQGYEVAAAPSGSEGLEMARSETPDLILLDIMMPTMDGYEVCRRLRSDPQLTHIPVIMFTAKTRVDDKVAGFEAGADDYLTKPTHPAELASRIRTLLTRSMEATPLRTARAPAPMTRAWHTTGQGLAWKSSQIPCAASVEEGSRPASMRKQ